MRGSYFSAAVMLAALPAALCLGQQAQDDRSVSWPPELPRAKDGAVTFSSADFLAVPADVAARRGADDAAPFDVAETPPTVDFAFHGNLGEAAVERRLWSSWGDICVASDGSVYCGIGDHGDAVGGDARCFIYRWNPQEKTLRQVVNVNAVVPPEEGRPAWSKVHAKIDEGPDGGIFFSATLNDGQRAGREDYHWTQQVPGGQLFRYDPQRDETAVFANLPPRRCTATSLIDRERGIWWCNLESGDGDALWGLDLRTKEPVLKTRDGAVAFNRAFALGRDGSIYFNGADGILRCDSAGGEAASAGMVFPDSPGMRSATRESKDGFIYGTTHKTNQLFRFRPRTKELSLLGPTWDTGVYTTVTILSPDERYLYYLPGSHGKAFEHGTPVVQLEIATGRRKVIAFLAAEFERRLGYVPGGSYGAKLSTDGSTLYVNLNGHAADAIRPASMKPIGFGLCGFAAIHIPADERP